MRAMSISRSRTNINPVPVLGAIILTWARVVLRRAISTMLSHREEERLDGA